MLGLGLTHLSMPLLAKTIGMRADAILRSFSPNSSSYPFSTLAGAYDSIGVALDRVYNRTPVVVLP